MKHITNYKVVPRRRHPDKQLNASEYTHDDVRSKAATFRQVFDHLERIISTPVKTANSRFMLSKMEMMQKLPEPKFTT